MHVRISSPSSSTEHEPHCAIPHPSRGPLNFSSLRSTKIRGVSGAADTTCFAPFTVNVSSLGISSLTEQGAPHSILGHDFGVYDNPVCCSRCSLHRPSLPPHPAFEVALRAVATRYHAGPHNAQSSVHRGGAHQ